MAQVQDGTGKVVIHATAPSEYCSTEAKIRLGEQCYAGGCLYLSTMSSRLPGYRLMTLELATLARPQVARFRCPATG